MKILGAVSFFISLWDGFLLGKNIMTGSYEAAGILFSLVIYFSVFSAITLARED